MSILVMSYYGLRESLLGATKELKKKVMKLLIML